MNAMTPPLGTGPILSYGVTLARKMSDDDVLKALGRIDADNLIGEARVPVCRTVTPNVVNVECWPITESPITTIIALEIAAKRLRTLHGFGPEGLTFTPVDLYDAKLMRQRAELIVDEIRDWSGPHHDFRQTRENCVRMLQHELAAASRLVEKV